MRTVNTGNFTKSVQWPGCGCWFGDTMSDLQNNPKSMKNILVVNDTKWKYWSGFCLSGVPFSITLIEIRIRKHFSCHLYRPEKTDHTMGYVAPKKYHLRQLHCCACSLKWSPNVILRQSSHHHSNIILTRIVIVFWATFDFSRVRMINNLQPDH